MTNKKIFTGLNFPQSDGGVLVAVLVPEKLYNAELDNGANYESTREHVYKFWYTYPHLTNTYYCQTVTINAGTRWDGASVPRCLRWFRGRRGRLSLGAFLHDFLWGTQYVSFQHANYLAWVVWRLTDNGVAASWACKKAVDLSYSRWAKLSANVAEARVFGKYHMWPTHKIE